MELSKEMLQINKFDIVSEIVKQPSLFEYASHELADAKEAKDRASNRLELIEAQSNLRIRNTAAEKGIKITEGIVAASVISDSEVIKAKEELVDAQKKVNVLQGIVTAMEQKCMMLGTLQKMINSQSYNLEPSYDGKKTAEYVEDQLNRGLNTSPRINGGNL